jgi:hypothetical protein
MSELKVNKVTPRSGTTVTLGDSGDSVAIPTGVGFNGFGFRNIVINGDMSIAQRGTSFTSLGGVSQYNLDRWETIGANVDSGRYQIDQSTDVPSGFTYSQKISCTTSEASQDADQQLYLEQQIEGLNSSYLKYYVASPDTVTLSFWVKSNLTGSYSVALKLSDNASAADSSGSRIYPTTYSISSADTWEKKSITITLDSTSEVKVINNGFAVATQFWLSAGTSRDGEATNAWKNNANAAATSDNLNLLGNTANEWYITGVQLEAGTTASDFEFLPVDVNLARCQRYFEKSYPLATAPGTAAQAGARSSSTLGVATTSYLSLNLLYTVPKRSNPTLTFYDMAGTSGKCTRDTFAVGGSDAQNISSQDLSETSALVFSNGTSNNKVLIVHFTAVAEL